MADFSAARSASRDSAPDRSGPDAAMTQAFAAIVNSFEDAVILKTIDGIVTYWNNGASTTYRMSAEHIIGRSYEVLVAPSALAEERARHARVSAGAAESGIRSRRVRGDGTLVDVVMSMSPVHDRTGAITGVASISRPVSAAERDAARFASLLEAAPDAILCVDPNGTIITVNAQVTNMFGYPRDELVGQPLETLLPEASRAQHVGLRTAFLRHPKIRAMGAGLALSGRRRDGSVFPVEVSLSPDHSDTETTVIAAVRDVTERRMIENSARENETRLRQLAESVDTVFILRQIDPPEILYVSPGCRAVLGVGPEEIMAAPDSIEVTVHPDDWARLEREYLPAARAGRSAQAEYRILTPDGASRWLRIFSTPVPNPAGPAERRVITVDDVSDRIRIAEALQAAEVEARTANEAKTQFLSRMSHELRTPLNAVLGFGQLLQIDLAGTPYAESVEQLLNGGRHLLHLINDVLDIARIEAGETSISAEPVHLGDLVEETMQLMAPLAEAGQVSLMAPVRSGDCLVLSDRQRLRQVLLNLLSNAVKYNRPGGKVWVERRVDADTVSITVHDDGVGINAELLSRLFVPFDRLGAESTGVDGTGIGLALTRSLVQLMHGTLTVDSKPGRGSGFTVTLPRARDASKKRLPDTRHFEPARDGNLPDGSRVLLYIEDNEPNVRVVEHVLRMRPEWTLIHAALGRLGAELAQAHQPDLILLDLHLPDTSGVDVLGVLKRNPDTSGLPVVIVTADATTGQSSRLLAAGAEAYVTKPLNIKELLGLLDQKASARPGPRRG